jgi:GR25 family glycosyltransferase involved in LPS biosynthesis
MIDIYIINLEHEIEKYNKLKKLLNDNNYKNINRIDAVYGKKIKDFSLYKKYFYPIIYNFFPNGALGCAISHYKTLETIYKNYIDKSKNNKTDEYALILEDDTIPLYNSEYLDNIVNSIPNNADILLINTFEILQKKTNNEFTKKDKFGIHPATAYIVKCNSIPKILNKKLFYYYDFTTFNYYKSLNIYIYQKDIFKTSFDESYNLQNSYTSTILYILIKKICDMLNISYIPFFLLFKAIKIPSINIELNGIQILYIIIFILSFCLLIFYLYI